MAPKRSFFSGALARRIGTLLVAAIALALPATWIVPAAPASAAPITKSLLTVGDTYASNYERTWGHGSAQEVRANGRDDAGLLAFPTAGVVPAGYSITGMSLRIYVRWNEINYGQPVVYPAGFFNESSTSYESRPSFRNTQISGYATARTGEWTEIPLYASEYVRHDNVSTFEVRHSNWQSSFAFASRESGNGARLIITMSPSGSGTTDQGTVTPPPQQVPASGGGSVPAPAQSAGFNTAKINDNFDNFDSIDLTGTGVAGKNWYTDRSFGRGKLPSGDLSISNSVLTINQSSESMNYAISTTSHTTKRGQSFQYGYFEARLAYDPANAPKTYGWPSFWAVSRNHALYQNIDRYGELDFIEAYHDPYQSHQGIYYGTVHDWTSGSGDRGSYDNHYWWMTGIDPREFHTYGALWTPGKVVWYFDGKPIITQNYSANAAPSPNPRGWPSGTYSILDKETAGMTLILGSGVNYPLKVDWVRVWQ